MNHAVYSVEIGVDQVHHDLLSIMSEINDLHWLALTVEREEYTREDKINGI